MDGTVSVAIAAPVPGPYDYAVPPGTELPPVGSYVQVPLGRRVVTGVVWGAGTGAIKPERLRAIAHVHDCPPMRDQMRRFVEWVARYVMSPQGAVLRMAVSAPAALDPPQASVVYAPSTDQPTETAAGGSRLTPQRRRVLAVLADGPPRSAGALAHEAACSVAVIKTMANAGLLVPSCSPTTASVPMAPRPLPKGPCLNDAQAAAASFLRDAVMGAGDKPVGPVLLDGVTGSGKTEVYFEAIAAAVEAGRQVLVLLPEIALSAQWLERFRHRFGFEPCAWHSEVTAARRRRTWRAVAEGRAQVVVGARSALFLPFPALALIVVDEEHDNAFKQEEGVIYNARDMAVVRAQIEGVPICLASATPSLETVANVRAGRYDCLVLPSRHGSAALPAVETVDLRRHPPSRGRFLSPFVADLVSETLGRDEQVMLFLNRRGYAPLTLCRSCGFRLTCPNCTAWLVEHRLTRRLICHHCGHSERPRSSCPECGAEDSFVACGPGVERIAEEVAERWPDARTVVMTSDLVQTAGQAADMVQRIQQHEADIVIGTQLVAKGHHFPLMTLVAVVDSDLGFNGTDFRAFERTYQLLLQVGGRSGRDAERAGRVLLQTHVPEHPVIAAMVSGDRDGFLEDLTAERQRFDLPPYVRMAAVIIAGPDADSVDQVAAALGRSAPRADDLDIAGPAPAPLAVLRGRHRRRFLVKAPRRTPLQDHLAQWLAQVRVPSSVRISIDIDPYNFL